VFFRLVKDVKKGKDMQTMLQIYVDLMKHITFIGTGTFFDSADLAEKYKDSPAALQHTLVEGRTMVCPMRGATMYEDMQHESKEARREKREMDHLAEETIRRFKKQKAESNKINEKQQQLLDEWLEFLKTSQEALEKREAAIKDLGRWIPPFTSESLNNAQTLVKAAEERCDAIKDSGEGGLYFREFLNTMADFKRRLNENKAAIDTQVKTAKGVPSSLVP